jgi:murein DD-endopeptidase MepM/ murein hydrolase activator NlpD
MPVVAADRRRVSSQFGYRSDPFTPRFSRRADFAGPTGK